jgi:hypothetical protein
VLSGLHRQRFGDGSSSKLLQTASLPMHELHQRPFFIRVLVPTGDPDGLRIVEKSNWPGVGVVFNRTNYKEVVNRGEFDKTGVYVLVGTSDDSILPAIYVGEGDPVKNRLNQHYSKKDFWDIDPGFQGCCDDHAAPVRKAVPAGDGDGAIENGRRRHHERKEPPKELRVAMEGTVGDPLRVAPRSQLFGQLTGDLPE